MELIKIIVEESLKKMFDEINPKFIKFWVNQITWNDFKLFIDIINEKKKHFNYFKQFYHILKIFISFNLLGCYNNYIGAVVIRRWDIDCYSTAKLLNVLSEKENNVK